MSASTKQQRELGRKGRVVRSVTESFKGLEAVARQRNAKGCYIERGAHPKEKEISQWLHGHEESEFAFGEVATAQVQVATQFNKCDSNCKDALCKDVIGGVDEIREACANLVAGLPPSFREDVRADAESIAIVCMRACPGVPWVTLRLEIVQYNACWRWHQDAYVGRAIVSYVGPGTYTAEDQAVRWDRLHEETNESSVPHESVKQMETNSVLIMKGDSWPNICGKGLVHKSPAVYGTNPPKRLILKVDLNTFQPQLDFEDGSDEDGEEEEDYDEDQTSIHGDENKMALKRLASSEGFKTAKAWKVRRR